MTTQHFVDAANHVFTSTVVAGKAMLVVIPVPPDAPMSAEAVGLVVMTGITGLAIGLLIGSAITWR